VADFQRLKSRMEKTRHQDALEMLSISAFLWSNKVGNSLMQIYIRLFTRQRLNWKLWKKSHKRKTKKRTNSVPDLLSQCVKKENPVSVFLLRIHLNYFHGYKTYRHKINVILLVSTKLIISY
jgi:hypothetical protein